MSGWAPLITGGKAKFDQWLTRVARHSGCIRPIALAPYRSRQPVCHAAERRSWGPSAGNYQSCRGGGGFRTYLHAGAMHRR